MISTTTNQVYLSTPDYNNNEAANAAALESSFSFTETHFDGLILRQDSGSETPGKYIDNLRVATTWSDAVVSNAISASLSNGEVEAVTFSVYPNPANEVLNIVSEDVAPIQLELINALGQVVYAAEASQSFDISAVNPGVYFARMAQNGKVAIQKVVIK